MRYQRFPFIAEIYSCPLCGKPVCEAPRGSGRLACINYQCDYMSMGGEEE